MKHLLVIIGLLILCQYQPPTLYSRDERGGYTIMQPGVLPPTYVIPSGNGGFMIVRPGEAPTIALPYGDGGLMVMPPIVPQAVPPSDQRDNGHIDGTLGW